MGKTPDVIIIGGGIVGLAIARRLACDGTAVTLYEKGICGAEASWAGAGVISPCSPHCQDVLAILRDRSVAVYSDFCAALHEESGIDPQYDRCGELELLFSEEARQIARSDVRATAGRFTPDGMPEVELRDKKHTLRLEPTVSHDIIGARECRMTAQVRNPRLLKALQEACIRAGVVIHEQTAVMDFLVEGNCVSGVQLDDGPVRSVSVILCAGAWSSGIGSRLESLMPVHPVRGQIVLMKYDERPLRHVISRGKTYLVPRNDGHLLLGATEEPDAGFVKRNTPSGLADLMNKGMALVPSIADAPVVTTWAGLRPGTPDNRPYIGAVPGLDNLLAATGHYRSGLILAPVTAEIISGLVNGKTYDLDLSCCAPGRAVATE